MNTSIMILPSHINNNILMDFLLFMLLLLLNMTQQDAGAGAGADDEDKGNANNVGAKANKPVHRMRFTPG